MEKLKPRDVQHLRMVGKISGEEYAVINNIQARGGLKPIVESRDALRADSLEGQLIAFYNGGSEPVADIRIGGNIRVYRQQHAELADSVISGLEAAGYNSDRYETIN